MNILLIGNPAAGSGRAERRIKEFVRRLKDRGHRVDIYISTGPGDARRKAGEAGPGLDRLVVAGGDGTINEVINGLVDPSLVPILHFATGTANMLALDIGLPTHPTALANVLESGEVRKVDLGFAGTRRFMLIASVGFDARVTEERRRLGGRPLGYPAYFLPIIRSLRRRGPAGLTVTVDDGPPHAAEIAMALKVRHYGGIFVFDENSTLESGVFHVCLFARGSIPSLLRYAALGLARRTGGDAGITRLAGRRVKIEAPDPVPVEVDGDYFGPTPVELILEPRAAAIVFPRNPGNGRP
jgi:YegS/Rv2252/BmrU family lipid kinase